MFSFLLLVIYLAFIGLGLPDSVLGSAWPSMFTEMNVPVSYAGIVSSIIAAGTIVSSLMSDRITLRFGAGKTTAFSVLMTAVALFGFSVSTEFYMLCLFGIPYGLGAGSVDAALNNYVALHYSAKHMSWLHCMWGLGASIGPCIMSLALTYGQGWDRGYLYISLIQIAISLTLFISLPKWKTRKNELSVKGDVEPKKPLSLKQIFSVSGVKATLLMFLCYCAIEAVVILWASSYLVINRGIDADTGAACGGLFLLGITLGRAISGFMTAKFNDTALIRLGSSVILVGVILVILPFGRILPLCGLVIMGLGCAPIYPSIIHSTPIRFGADKSQALIGVQMASAYTGTCLMPPLFGIIADYVNISFFPIFVSGLLIIEFVMHELLCKKHPLK